MGMATALGAPLAPTAGAIVSGAYFGDKLSPLSDSTNISAIGAGASLYGHIRQMLYTAVPSFVIAGLVYAFMARLPIADGDLPESARKLLKDINLIYSMSIITLIPVLVVVVGIVMRTPPVLAMAASSITACLVGFIVQGFTLQSALLAAVRGFNVSMLADKELEIAAIGQNASALLNRGGLYSMVNTLVVIIAAFLLAGAMDVSGALNRLIEALLSIGTSTFALVGATMAA